MKPEDLPEDEQQGEKPEEGRDPLDAPPQASAPPPPAASAVVRGKRSEKGVNLEAELEAERGKRKKVETRNMELEDEIRRFKQASTPPPGPQAPRRNSWTLFEEED